eukprot:828152-Rhodomonas_salina.1
MAARELGGGGEGGKEGEDRQLLRWAVLQWLSAKTIAAVTARGDRLNRALPPPASAWPRSVGLRTPQKVSASRDCEGVLSCSALQPVRWVVRTSGWRPADANAQSEGEVGGGWGGAQERRTAVTIWPKES